MVSIRKQLKIEFDDVQLNSFCLDHFPEVYDKFTEGMQRDRKINLLFKHCRGQPDGLQNLLRLIDEWKK